jgi:PAS domain S-box-containing protein
VEPGWPKRLPCRASRPCRAPARKDAHAFAFEPPEKTPAERVASESEERFRLIADTTSEVFWMMTLDLSRLLYISPAYERLWGRSCESLYRDPQSFLEPIHPDDLGLVLDNFEKQKAGLPFDVEYRIHRPDGALRWIWSRGYPVRAEGAAGALYVGVAQDITERKEVEMELAALAERFRLVARATNDGVWDWDMVNDQAWWNDVYYEAFGYERDLAPSYERWVERIHPEDRARVTAGFARAVETGDAAWSDEYRFATKAGSFRDVFDRAYVLHDADGRPIRMLGALMDITDPDGPRSRARWGAGRRFACSCRGYPMSGAGSRRQRLACASGAKPSFSWRTTRSSDLRCARSSLTTAISSSKRAPASKRFDAGRKPTARSTSC